MAALYRRDAALASAIDALPFVGLPSLQSARDGQPTVQLTADDGRPFFLHSRYAPADEAERFVAALPEVENPTFVVHGVGLGYHLAAIRKRWRNPLILLSERDLSQIKLALCVTDLSGVIASGRLVILTQPDRGTLHGRLAAGNADLMLGMQFVAPPYSLRRDTAFHEQMRAALCDWVAAARMQVVTLLKTAQVTFRNVSYALVHYLAEPGVDSLKGKAAGFPAIIVSAGPSLARNIRQLAALRERAVIIAVQTVLKPLLSMGIVPDFVTSLDFHDVSGEFFRGVSDIGDCILVAEPKATPAVLDGFPGRRRVLRHRYFDSLLRESGPPRGILKAGTTVAHLAFYLAEHLGCDPILLVGQDLAYTDGLFYLPGSPIEQIWSPELGRFATMEMKQWERIVRNRGILRLAKSAAGRPLLSDDLLFTYMEQFQRDFLESRSTIIQCSEGGAALEGADSMPLAEAAARHCTRPLKREWLADSAAVQASPHLLAAPAVLDARLDEIRRVRQIASETHELLARLEGLVEKPIEFNRLIARIDELRTLITSYPQTYNLVIEVSATAELRRHIADRQIADDDDDAAGGAKRRLRRDREFVAAFLSGCEFLEKTVAEAAARLRERRQ
ncbi:MAG: motility associated factor glycosyltransferase family protein [Planctomycetes bacterium]|nr:motility associated factor glycosyltransferase family protein [Planctomycetota bacterium]